MDHDLLKYPTVPSMAHDISELEHFPMRDSWGYYLEDKGIIITKEDPSDYIHLTIDEKWIYPLEWANAKIYPDFETAFEQSPESFKYSDSLVEAIRNWKDPRGIFFEENKHTLKDLEEDFIQFYSDDDSNAKAEYLGEMIHYFLRSGQVERGLKLLKEMPLDAFYTVTVSIPCIIAYLAKIGQTEIAQELTDKIVPLYDAEATKGYVLKFDAWLGAAGHLLGNDQAYRLEQTIEMLKEVNLHESSLMYLVTANAFAGKYEQAVEVLQFITKSTRDISWTYSNVATELMFQSNDFEIIKSYLKLLHSRIGSFSEETLEQFCTHFIKINRPEILLEWLPTLEEKQGDGKEEVRIKLLDHYGKVYGGEALLDYINEEYVMNVATGKYDKAAKILVVLAPHLKKEGLPLLRDLIQRTMESDSISPSFLNSMSKVLPDFEQQELLLRLHQAADRLTIYNHMDAVIYLEDYRDFSMKSLQKIVDADDERRFIAKIKTTAPYYQALVNILLKKTDGEENDSEYLLGTLMKQGDYENAYTVFSRYSQERAFHKIMARNAIQQGNFTLGLYFMKKLPSSGGTEYYDYETIQALVRDCWDNQNWICDVF